MMVGLLRQRKEDLNPQNELEEEHALKEVFQECILMALDRAGLFSIAAFHGGTALRILYGLPRFSEDLDFTLLKEDSEFRWAPYADALRETLRTFGVDLNIREKSEVNPTAVRQMLLKDNYLTKFLELRSSSKPKRILIKLEIDTRPPGLFQTELKYLNFPEPFSVIAFDPPSAFAGKSHALLCRPYEKGRDWYDFLWFVRHRTHPNLTFLAQALNQLGPWQNQQPLMTEDGYLQALRERIRSLDWEKMRRDVEPFLRANEYASLHVWSADFFLSQVDAMEGYMKKI